MLLRERPGQGLGHTQPPDSSRTAHFSGPAALSVAPARTDQVAPDAIVALQRSVGNAAVVQLLRSAAGPLTTGRPPTGRRPRQAPAAGSGLDRVQRIIVHRDGVTNIWAEEIARARAAEEDEAIKTAIGQLHDLDEEFAVAGYADLVARIREGAFDHVLPKKEQPDPYVECQARGAKIWGAVTKGQGNIKASLKKKTPLPSKPGTEAKFMAHYTTEPLVSKAKGVYQVKSQPNKVKTNLDGGKPAALYTNTFDVVNKIITAERNWASDPDSNAPLDLNGPNRLNNSEILWNQYRLAADQYHADHRGPGAAKDKKLYKVKRVVREHIENPTTLAVVRDAYPKGKHWRSGASATWKPGQDHFLAVLGTPNVSGVGYILADHMAEMEGRARTISRIEARRGTAGGESLDLIVHLERL